MENFCKKETKKIENIVNCSLDVEYEIVIMFCDYYTKNFVNWE